MSLILDRVIDISRLKTDTGNSNKESYQSYSPLQNIACNIQPAAAEDTVIADGVFGQTFICFTTVSGILEGDKAIDQETGEVFIVKGKSNWMTPSLAPHAEYLLVQPSREAE